MSLYHVLIEMPTLQRGLLFAWILEMIAVPIFGWLWHERGQRVGIVLGVCLQVITVFAILIRGWGTTRAVITAGGVIILGWAAEFIGSHTGFPFGRYHYTDRLQPQIGHVPLLIPCAWLMMLPPAWAVADLFTYGQRGWLFVLLSAIAFTMWDLFLDPQMVAWDFWKWESLPTKGACWQDYFGIPWTNYLGWMLVSAIITIIVTPPPLPLSLLVIYTLTWFLETFGQLFFWHLPGPAIVGGTGMGMIVLLVIIKM
ncbi:MAG: carotenoid biosynthesis protein [Anaerolineae bacterium]|nr:carotenoid biosynthesis protein [Anaerolineae bacterium]